MGSKSISVVLKIIDDKSINNNLVKLPPELHKTFNKSNMKLKVGVLEEEITCASNKTENVVEIPESIAGNLGLIEGMTTNLIVKDDKICLGPVIAVFASNGTVRKANIQNPSFRLTELMRANKEANTIAYYFSVKDVDFVNHKINGTYLDEKDGRWKQRYFPFPDVLYDRGGGTLKKQKVISKYIRKQLQFNKDLKRFNARYYFDKWDVHEQLVVHEDMKPYLPVTILYNEPEDLISMFEKYPTVYIKYCYGSNGRGVARAIKLSNGGYNLSYFHGEVIEYNLKSLGSLLEQLQAFFGNKKIIIQSAIDVMEYNGRNVDMRATVQRNGKGELGVYAYPVRLGQEKCPITSTKSGSTVYTFEKFFTDLYSFSEKEIEDLKKRINEMLIKSFKYVEEAYGSFGELGIDFAIDKNWNIWFIECNAKPGKDALCMCYDKDTIKRAFLNPLEYAKYICNF